MADTIYLDTPGAATYGNDPDAAYKAMVEAQKRAKAGAAPGGQLTDGATFANNQHQNGRPGAVMDAGAANNQASGANGNQAGAIELARRMAMGQQPSQGALQMQQGLNQATQQQSAMAAGARGSGAIAGAQANQRANVSNLQQNAWTGAGMLRSQDMAQGRGMYASLTGQARDQNGQAIGIANDFGQKNAAQGDAYRLGFGDVGVGLGGVSDAFNGQDFTRQRTGLDPAYANDDAAQDEAGRRIVVGNTTRANNIEDRN